MAFLRRKPKDSAPQGSFERLGTQSAKAGGGPAFNVLAAAFLGLSALMCLCYAAYFVPGLALPFAALRPQPSFSVQLLHPHGDCRPLGRRR